MCIKHSEDNDVSIGDGVMNGERENIYWLHAYLIIADGRGSRHLDDLCKISVDGINELPS